MGNIDDIKGRIKEGVGEATDDKDLEREGKVDRLTGKVKDATESLSDKAKDAIRRD
ncbi:MAG: CsbD family protein [Acidimicrobiales bacterium]